VWLIGVQKFNPSPEGLIHLWEDYTFMLLCNEAWHSPEFAEGQQLNRCRKILSRASPQLMRILYAYRVSIDYSPRHFLFRIHILLGLSWDELRAAISSLRTIIPDNFLLPDGSWALRELLNCWDETFLGGLDSNSVWLELAKGGLRLIGGTSNGRLPA
jgi:hypothetical protein